MTPKKVHLFFEQSGTFKDEFNKINIPALDYDLQNEYGKTDIIIDLFSEIIIATYTHDKTVFDSIGSEDLIFAFFPCTYFADVNQMFFCGTSLHFNGLSLLDKLDKIIERSKERNNYYLILLYLCRICVARNIPLIVENPYSPNHYLYNNFPFKSFIDRDRSKRGDYYQKPTQYYFINIEPATTYYTLQPSKIIKKIYQMTGRHSYSDRLTGKERSEISPEYARNFFLIIF